MTDSFPERGFRLRWIVPLLVALTLLSVLGLGDPPPEKPAAKPDPLVLRLDPL